MSLNRNEAHLEPIIRKAAQRLENKYITLLDVSYFSMPNKEIDTYFVEWADQTTKSKIVIGIEITTKGAWVCYVAPHAYPISLRHQQKGAILSNNFTPHLRQALSISDDYRLAILLGTFDVVCEDTMISEPTINWMVKKIFSLKRYIKF
jgi:hypothetical protein